MMRSTYILFPTIAPSPPQDDSLFPKSPSAFYGVRILEITHIPPTPGILLPFLFFTYYDMK